MKRIIFIYISTTLLLALKNLINWWRCTYISARMQMNIDVSPYKNLNYTISIISLLKRLDCYYTKKEISKMIVNPHGMLTIIKHLYEVRGIYYHQIVHSFTWPYRVMRKITVFKPLSDVKNNPIISTILCIGEGFVIYLLGLYLDTTGIGNKILAFLLDFLTEAVEHLAALFHR